MWYGGKTVVSHIRGVSLYSGRGLSIDSGSETLWLCDAEQTV